MRRFCYFSKLHISISDFKKFPDFLPHPQAKKKFWKTKSGVSNLHIHLQLRLRIAFLASVIPSLVPSLQLSSSVSQIFLYWSILLTGNQIPSVVGIHRLQRRVLLTIMATFPKMQSSCVYPSLDNWRTQHNLAQQVSCNIQYHFKMFTILRFRVNRKNLV